MVRARPSIERDRVRDGEGGRHLGNRPLGSSRFWRHTSDTHTPSRRFRDPRGRDGVGTRHWRSFWDGEDPHTHHTPSWIESRFGVVLQKGVGVGAQSRVPSYLEGDTPTTLSKLFSKSESPTVYPSLGTLSHDSAGCRTGTGPSKHHRTNVLSHLSQCRVGGRTVRVSTGTPSGVAPISSGLRSDPPVRSPILAPEPPSPGLHLGRDGH